MTERRKNRIHMTIFALFFTLVILGCSSGEVATSEPISEPASSEEITEVVSEEVSEPEEVVIPQNVRIEDGTFIVGEDLPAGEYIISGNGNGEAYYELSNTEKKLSFGHFTNNAILTVDNGQSFILENAYAVPVAEGMVDTTKAGTFKVGLHIEAGEYKLVPDDDATDGFGLYSIESSSDPLEKEYIDSNLFEEPVKITVEEGEYLILSHCHIEAETEVSLEEEQTESTVEDEPTMGERNALGSAKDYLQLMPFSYTGLIEQLEFEGYTHEEAVYATDHCGADWNEQAAKSAKIYLDMMSFSKSGLIEQLEFEGFTHEQAVYGVEANGY